MQEYKEERRFCRFPISYSSSTRRQSSCLRSTQFRENTNDVDLLQRKKRQAKPTLHRNSRAKWPNHTPTNEPFQNVKGSLKHRYMLLFDPRMRRDISIPFPCIRPIRSVNFEQFITYPCDASSEEKKGGRKGKKEKVQFTVKIQENPNPRTYASSTPSSLWLGRLMTVRRPGKWGVSRARDVALNGQCNGMNGWKGRLFKWVAYVESNPEQS